VELSPVRVTVHEARLAWVDLPLVGLAVRCSSGTYVRGLARDLGEALGVGAHLSALRRTAVGRFRVRDALPLDALDHEGAVEAVLIEPADAVGHFPAVEIAESAVGALRDGRRIPVGTGAASDPHTVHAGRAPNEASRVPLLVAVTRQRELLAIAELEAGMLKPRKVFAA
jgi:tRNA pseudouridine55 synthase